MTVDGYPVHQRSDETDAQFARRLDDAVARARAERMQRTRSGRQALSSTSGGACPKGGQHEAGTRDARGRLHCRKCGRFM